MTFDLDNTLWDVEPALLRAEEAQRQWLLEHRPGTMDNIGHEELWELKKRVWKAHPELAHNVTAMRQRFLEELQRAAGFDTETARAGAREAFAAFLLERQRVELYADALEVLQGLAGRYRLGALTNGNADVYKTDAGEYFDFAFLAEEIGASKPAPDMFHAAIETTGVEAQEIVHVGDNPEHDILGALSVGMHAIWLNADAAPWSHNDEDNRTPHEIIGSIGELPAAVGALQDRLETTGKR
ncbi:haloacid dehalogenase superfamily, subfamily IA [Congregibacter litoralis KT71]|uniref:Haloacid dehalogenase superfamily, subfamily IA n=1 Tax=Congregibacter litoralis KT71 TaxID=314285 RepID=A4A9E9_9GAMM|nr:haloacid dehalogenase superfamily, subfamily IA [Congregibacter litoralis KT71]